MGIRELKRPWRYREGQRRAINALGFPEMDKNLSILDIGCGIGTGLLHFRKLGFKYLLGIENDPNRAYFAKRRGLDIWQANMEAFWIDEEFNIIWSSHSFEHTINPDATLQVLKWHTYLSSLFFFILPYPDSNPAELHTASRQIGLDIEDDGKTVVKWFEDRGLELLYQKRDSFREPEIWLKFKRK